MKRLLAVGAVVAAMLGATLSSPALASASAGHAARAAVHVAGPAAPHVKLTCPSSTVCLYNSSGFNTEGLGCTATTWVKSQLVEPIVYLVDACSVRVWIHQNQNGSGWSHCFSPQSATGIATDDQDPGNLQVTTNKSAC